MYGGGVLTYFCFLQWLLLVNTCIFALVFTFVTLPQMLLPTEGDTLANMTAKSYSIYALRALRCSRRYDLNVPDNGSVVQSMADLVQGTVSDSKLLASC